VLVKKVDALQGKVDTTKNDIQIVAKHLKLASTKLTSHDIFINDFQKLLDEKVNEAVQKSLENLKFSTLENNDALLLSEKMSEMSNSIMQLQNRVGAMENSQGNEDLNNKSLNNEGNNEESLVLGSRIEKLEESI